MMGATMSNETDDGAEKTTAVCEEPGSPARQGTTKRLRSGVTAGWDEGMGCGTTGDPNQLG